MQWASATTLAALLVWATVVYTTPRYVRAHDDVYIVAYWRAQIFLALALTVSIPAIYLWIDDQLGIANASRWIANMLILVAGYFLDGFFVAVTRGSPAAWKSHRWALLYLLLTLAAMAWLLWRANLTVESVALELSQVNTSLILYRMVFLAFFTFVTVRLIVSCSRYRAATPNPAIRLGMQAMIVGGYWGIVYIVTTMAVVLLPGMLPGRLWMEPLLQLLVNLSIFAAVICILVGVNLPRLGQRVGILTAIQHLRYLRTYWGLRPLWRMLTARVPEVVLPTSITWYAAMLRLQDMEFLLHRRVIEILDAWRVVDGTPAASPTLTDLAKSAAPDLIPQIDTSDLVGDAHQNSNQYDALSHRSACMRRQAKADAYHLQQVMLLGKPHGSQPGLVRHYETAEFRPDTYAEQLLYLEVVAKALRRLTWDPRLMLYRLIEKGRRFMSKHLLRSTSPDEHGHPSSADDAIQAETSSHVLVDRASQLARIVSEVANPLFVALPTFLIVALHTAPTWQRGVLWWLVTTLGISAAPFVFVYQGVRQGRYTDHHLSVRTQRLVPLVVGLLCAAIALVLLLALQASAALLATVAGVLVCGICTLAITTRWKISFHLVGAAGAATVLTLLFGPIALIWAPFVALIGWARWQLHAHTVAQALAGTALAVVITVGMFRGFGLI